MNNERHASPDTLRRRRRLARIDGTASGDIIGCPSAGTVRISFPPGRPHPGSIWLAPLLRWQARPGQRQQGSGVAGSCCPLLRWVGCARKAEPRPAGSVLNSWASCHLVRFVFGRSWGLFGGGRRFPQKKVCFIFLRVFVWPGCENGHVKGAWAGLKAAGALAAAKDGRNAPYRACTHVLGAAAQAYEPGTRAASAPRPPAVGAGEGLRSQSRCRSGSLPATKPSSPGAKLDPPPGPHPAQPSSSLDPGGERRPISPPLAPLIAQLVWC
jgi:hypothetical protein